MRKTPLRRPMDKSRSTSRSKASSSATALQQHSSALYYCHYKNATYMGGIKAFKKEGRGLLLHDSGMCALTSYHNDIPHGHNVYLDNHALLSVNFYKGRVEEIVYRLEGFLVQLRYNADRELDGNALLLNYVTKSITYATFKKGQMFEKIEETDLRVVNRVFELNQLQFLIGRTHAKVIKYDFDKPPGMECTRQGNKIIVGFEKQGFINGLGFMALIRGTHGGYDPDTLRNQDDFELKVLERGYYINTQLNGMGDKMFKNGNFYRGEFKHGIFEGNGVLINNEKRNWVSGLFREGNLVELIEYSSEDEGKKFDRLIENLHERRSNWINNEITLIDPNVFMDEISKIISGSPNRNVRTLQQRKQQVLRRIQQKFITQSNTTAGGFDESVRQLAKQPSVGSNVNRFIHSFTPDNGQNKTTKGFSFKLTPEKESSRGVGSDLAYSKNQQSRLNSSKRMDEYHKKRLVHQGSGWANKTLGSDRKKKSLTINPLDSYSKRMNKTHVPIFSGNNADPSDAQNSNSRAAQASRGYPYSTDRSRSSQGRNLDSRRMVGKGKIFQSGSRRQAKDESSPYFAYNKTDTLRNMSSRNAELSR